MPLPASLEGRLALPVVAAPMFLTSGPDLVIACCRGGVLGTFPALNQRTTAGFAAWLTTIEAVLVLGGVALASLPCRVLTRRSSQ